MALWYLGVVVATPTLKECCDFQMEGLRNYTPEEATNELLKLFPQPSPRYSCGTAISFEEMH
jgi:hypothetical protein